MSWSQCAQLFQPIALPLFYILGEPPVCKFYDLDTKYKFYLIVTQYCKTIIRHTLGLQKFLHFLFYFHGPQYAPPLLPSLVSPNQTNWPVYSSAIYGQNLEVVSLPASFQAITFLVV